LLKLHRGISVHLEKPELFRLMDLTSRTDPLFIIL